MPIDPSTLPTEAQKALTTFPEFQVRDFNDFWSKWLCSYW